MQTVTVNTCQIELAIQSHDEAEKLLLAVLARHSPENEAIPRALAAFRGALVALLRRAPTPPAVTVSLSVLAALGEAHEGIGSAVRALPLPVELASELGAVLVSYQDGLRELATGQP